jgi:hypothetical protein
MSTIIPARHLLSSGSCSAPCLLASPEPPCTCRCGGTYHGALAAAEIPGEPLPVPAPLPEPAPAQRDCSSEEDGFWYWHDGPLLPSGWPPNMWCRAWWKAERGQHGTDEDVDAVLNSLLCPVRSALDALGAHLTEPQRDDNGLPTAWAQPDACGSPLAGRCAYAGDEYYSTRPHDWHWTSVHCASAGVRAQDSQAHPSQEGFLRALAETGRCQATRPGPDTLAAGFGDRLEAQIAGAVLLSAAYGRDVSKWALLVRGQVAA